jgi:hypothetical protein
MLLFLGSLHQSLVLMVESTSLYVLPLGYFKSGTVYHTASSLENYLVHVRQK